MLYRLFPMILLGFLLLTVTACSRPEPTARIEATVNKPTLAEIGNPLFKEAAWPLFSEDAAALADPIRLPLCHLTVLDRVDVPSKEDGTIAWIGVPLKNGERVAAKDLYIHTRTGLNYRRLRPGERVEQGQIIALLNDERAALECDIANSNIEGAKDELEAATKAIEYYVENVKIEEKAKSSIQAIVAAKANLAKATSERSSKDWAVKRTIGEDKKSREKLGNHLIKAPISGEIVQFLKQVGEGARASEAVMQIQNGDRLGIQGNLEVQHISKINVGSDVFLEPAILDAPLGVRSPHTSSKAISAVAGGIRQGKQVVVSASEDGAVYVWDPIDVHALMKHSGPVRAVAVTRPGLKSPLILTGCDDGKVRLWSLDSPGKEPLRMLDGHHEGGVQAVAFSPDGELCVTADDRGEIFLFDTTGKLKYKFPREHNSSVSSLSFLPQGRVVSTGRDNIALIWKVGDKSAAIETPFENRSGEVTNLGVSDDGGLMLLDLDKSRLRVIDLGLKTNRGTLEQAGDSKFAGFALISPIIGAGSDRVILTTSGTDGVIQVWRWTTGAGRGAELRKLVCNGRTTPSCAAFSPIAQSGYIIAGTRRGDVLLWPMPVEQELNNRYRARITSIDSNLESSGRTVRVHAEFDNPEDPRLRLRPGTTATMVIPRK
ncbi:MAG: hypothetical protein K8T89_22845 [Planctomycetes bacterium]|nr:hypothetical protein [Planctomycetota bacterium]